MKKQSIFLVSSGLVLLIAGVISLNQGWQFLLDPAKPQSRDPHQNSPIEKLDGSVIPNEYLIKNQRDEKIPLTSNLSQTKWNLIHFWATWCPPCREELVSLDGFRKSQNHLQVMTMSADFRWAEVIPYVTKLNFPLLPTDFIDEGGGVARKFKIEKFPETLVVSPSGKMVFKLLGAQPWEDPRFVQWLNQHFEESTQ